MNVPVAQLSCEQCQRRKRKCSKTVPCEACVKAGITCTAVQRHRLPRGKSGKHKSSITDRQALRAKVGRLENLVQQLQQKSPDANDPDTAKLPASKASGNGNHLGSFVAQDFWTDLSSEVAGLKDILEHPDSLESEEWSEELTSSNETPSSKTGSQEDYGGSHGLLFDTADSTSDNYNLSLDLKNRLLDVYKERVDAIFKPMHWPSTLNSIRLHHSNGNWQEKQDQGSRAVEHAIYFIAACSLFDHELDRRPTLVKYLRQSTERALIDAGLLTTTSLVVLQAFVLYLAAIRACQSNAQQWTLTAIAVRLANAQGIPSSLASADLSLDMEVRRRVWHCIAVLDIQCAFDRGSQTLIKSNDLHSLPSDLNDFEIGKVSNLSKEVTAQTRWTDMSLSFIMYRANICQRRVAEIGLSLSDSKIDPVAAGHEQAAVLAEFEGYVRRLSIICGSSPSDLQKYAIAVAEESLVAIRLLLHRPLHRRSKRLMVASGDDFDVLRTATEVLERSQMKRTQYEFAPWAWFQWVKWYALAVVLAELCGKQNSPLAERAWTVAQLSFHDYAKDVADTKKGLLWKPIARLMRKVESVRQPARTLKDGNSIADGTVPMALEAKMPANPISDQDSEVMMKDVSELFPGAMELDDIPWLQWDLLISDFNDPASLDEYYIHT